MMAASSSSSSSSSPCAACKFLRRKCTAECVFAPYFPPDQPHKFSNVHKIFGASNISKLLNELPPHQREDAVNSLAYEAEARVKDPVYGCVGAISVLQRQISHLQQELAIAHSDLARLGGMPTIMSGIGIPSPSLACPPCSSLQVAGMGMTMGMGMMGVPQQQHSQLLPHALSATASPFSKHLSREAATLLDQLQRDTQLTREQLVEQITRAGGGSLEVGLAAIASMAGASFTSGHTASDCGSGSSGGGHLSPP